MTDLNKLTLADSARRAARQEILRDRADAGVPWRHRARQPAAQRLRAADAGAGAGAGEGERQASEGRRRAPARRAAARQQGSVLHQGRAHDRVLEDPRRLHADLRIDRRRQSVECRRRHAGQAQLRRVRHGLLQRDERLRAGRLAVAAQGQGRRRSTTSSCRAARRAARPPRLPPICASAPPPPTPAARSASRRRSPAPSASSRPTGAARAGASSRSPPRSTRRGRSPRPCATPRSC